MENVNLIETEEQVIYYIQGNLVTIELLRYRSSTEGPRYEVRRTMEGVNILIFQGKGHKEALEQLRSQKFAFNTIQKRLTSPPPEVAPEKRDWLQIGKIVLIVLLIIILLFWDTTIKISII